MPAAPKLSPPFAGASSAPGGSKSNVLISWDSEELCRRAENLELEELAAISVNPALLSTLDGLLLEVYAMLHPEPADYEQRSIMVDVFNKMAHETFGNKNGFPVVEAFGSFTMDLFTPRSDLDLSVNFNADTEDQFARKDKISVIRKFAKVLYSHERHGRCYGVLPIVSARVPVLKVIDRGTGIECDISVENKDGMTRSMVFKLISSLDERFRMLSYLMKFWAKINDVNSSKDRTMSSMSIISLVAFHLQTRRPPILPAFSALLKDGSDVENIKRNMLQFKEFGSRNRESVAELFESLMCKLVSVESLWGQGLCASNFEGLWIYKTWEKGVGNLSVEDFLDRSQNFARAVGKEEMQKICRCLRFSVFNLSDFFRGKIDASKLKSLLFGHLNLDELASAPCLNRGKRKRNHESKPDQVNRNGLWKRVKHTDRANNRTAGNLPKPTIFVPPLPHQLGPTQSTNQFVYIPQPLMTPPGFGYGLPPLHLPLAPRFGQGLPGQPQGNLIYLNHGTQRLQQRQDTFVPLPVQPVGNLFHPFYGNQQHQPGQNRNVERMTYR